MQFILSNIKNIDLLIGMIGFLIPSIGFIMIYLTQKFNTLFTNYFKIYHAKHLKQNKNNINNLIVEFLFNNFKIK